jgi:glycosyltransferase involved in cell wall biosynthesis
MSEPLVSVIMPVYNCVAFVDEAIESMVNQTYSNLEIFIVDDCSTDGTKEKVEKWAKQDTRIKPFYKSVNSGYVDSLNMAIGLSNGEYIARMDGDDISLPERIEKQVEFMEFNKDANILGTGHILYGSNRIFLPQTEPTKIKVGLILNNQISHPTVIFRRSFLMLLPRLYNSEYIPMEDHEFWSFLSHKTKIYNINNPLLVYRIHNNGSSRLKNFDFTKYSIIHQNLMVLDPFLKLDMVYNIIYLIDKKHQPKNTIEYSYLLNYLMLLINLNKSKRIFDIIIFNSLMEKIMIKVIDKLGWKNALIFNKNKLKTLFLILKVYLRKKFDKNANDFMGWNYLD